MHNRIVPRLADGRRFLLGDAGHLSSPFAGEGLNTALMDAADIAWKLALVLRGAAQPALLDSFAIERGLADQHVLEVSDQVHETVMGLVAAYRGRQKTRTPAHRTRPGISPSSAAVPCWTSPMPAARWSASMSRSGYCPAPAPGSRFPERSRLSGTGHHVLVFGDADLRRLRARWSGWSRWWTAHGRVSTPPGPGYPKAGPSWSGRTA